MAELHRLPDALRGEAIDFREILNVLLPDGEQLMLDWPALVHIVISLVDLSSETLVVSVEGGDSSLQLGVVLLQLKHRHTLVGCQSVVFLWWCSNRAFFLWCLEAIGLTFLFNRFEGADDVVAPLDLL